MRASRGIRRTCAVLDEVAKYKAEPLLPLKTTPDGGLVPWAEQDCPIKWWATNAHAYPVLSKLAFKYLSVPMSSVATEVLFSDTGVLTMGRRHAVRQAMLNAQVVLRRRRPVSSKDDALPVSCFCNRCQAYRNAVDRDGYTDAIDFDVDNVEPVAPTC